MVGFKSDKQRKGFFASKGNPKSNVNPVISKSQLSKKQLENLSKGFRVNGTAFFSNKRNANRFGNILKKKGFKVVGEKSGAGPTVESEAGIKTGKSGKSFLIIVKGKK